MKKHNKILAFVLTAFMAFSLAATVGCSNNPCKDGNHSFVDGVCTNCGEHEPENSKKLMRIALTGYPAKTEYISGETFDPTGMVVTAYYNDSSKEEVTNYTISKTTALSREDTEITISFGDKSVVVPISVKGALQYNELLTVSDAESKIYTVEAEAIDYENCINSNDHDKPIVIETVNQNYPVTSGGKSVGTLSVIGNKFGFVINSEVTANATFVMRASACHIDIPVNDYMEVKFSEKVLSTEHMLKWTDGHWFDWENVYFRDVELVKGANTVTIEIKKTVAPNFDCFYLMVNPADGEEIPEKPGIDFTITDTAVKEYKLEAEALNLKNCVSQNGARLPFTEPNSDGGLNLAAMSVKGNKFGFIINNKTGEELDAYIVMRASANGGNMDLDSLISTKWNGVEIKTGGKLTWTGDWNVCEDVVISPLILQLDENSFEMELINGECPNMDYFKIVLGKYVRCDITVSDQNVKEYKIEAEKLDLSACESNNGMSLPCTETNSDGGLSLVAMGKKGNKFGFSVNNTTGSQLTVNILMRASANGGNMNIDELFITKWNGATIQTGGNLTWIGSWNVCEDVIIYSLTLESGFNMLEVELTQDNCPNIDYFKLMIVD